MNIVIATLYGFTFWLSCLSYAVITNGRWGLVAIMMPLIVSGSATALLILDLALHVAWRALRPKPAPPDPARATQR